MDHPILVYGTVDASEPHRARCDGVERDMQTRRRMSKQESVGTGNQRWKLGSVDPGPGWSQFAARWFRKVRLGYSFLQSQSMLCVETGWTLKRNIAGKFDSPLENCWILNSIYTYIYNTQHWFLSLYINKLFNSNDLVSKRPSSYTIQLTQIMLISWKKKLYSYYKFKVFIFRIFLWFPIFLELIVLHYMRFKNSKCARLY